VRIGFISQYEATPYNEPHSRAWKLSQHYVSGNDYAGEWEREREREPRREPVGGLVVTEPLPELVPGGMRKPPGLTCLVLRGIYSYYESGVIVVSITSVSAILPVPSFSPRDP